LEQCVVGRLLGHSIARLGKRALPLYQELISQVPGAHTYHPRYSGSRDQENQVSKSARVNSSQDPILKIPNTKKGWCSGSSDRGSAWQAWDPEFKPQYHKTKKGLPVLRRRPLVISRRGGGEWVQKMGYFLENMKSVIASISGVGRTQK
jgi:hypothetical protein